LAIDDGILNILARENYKNCYLWQAKIFIDSCFEEVREDSF